MPRGYSRHTITLDDETWGLARDGYAKLQDKFGFGIAWGAYLGSLIKHALRDEKPKTGV